MTSPDCRRLSAFLGFQFSLSQIQYIFSYLFSFCLFTINIFRGSEMEPISLPEAGKRVAPKTPLSGGSGAPIPINQMFTSPEPLHQRIFKMLFSTTMGIASVTIILFLAVVLSVYMITSSSVPSKPPTPKLSHVNRPPHMKQKVPRILKKNKSIVSQALQKQNIKLKSP
jgi:hypothetical protein